MAPLSGKTVLLTGASGGLGAEMARALAREGCHLALAGFRGRDRLEALVQELSAAAQPGQWIVPFIANLSDPGERAALVEQVQGQVGLPDILVNNSGIEQWGHFSRMAEADIARIVDVNVTATLLLTRLLLPGMIARGSGHVVNIGSMAAKAPPAFDATYAATKAALAAWTFALNEELRGTGVRASVIHPTFVSGVGLFSQHGVRSPRIAREVTPEQVSRALVKVLRRGSLEELVVNLPARPLLALRELFPSFYAAFFRLTGLAAFLRRLGEMAENKKQRG